MLFSFFAAFAFFARDSEFWLRFCRARFFVVKSFFSNFYRCYLNSGITLSANRRIFFSAISCGMPPK